MGLDQEKRRPQPALSLANNLSANAADLVKAVHGAGQWSKPRPGVKARLAPLGALVAHFTCSVHKPIPGLPVDMLSPIPCRPAEDEAAIGQDGVLPRGLAPVNETLTVFLSFYSLG